MKCVGIQYLEAIRRLKASGFKPTRTVYLSFVPDEEIGGHDGAEKFAESDIFKALNVGIVLDEGQLLFLVLYPFELSSHCTCALSNWKLLWAFYLLMIRRT